jgi:hypothetical protein
MRQDWLKAPLLSATGAVPKGKRSVVEPGFPGAKSLLA